MAEVHARFAPVTHGVMAGDVTESDALIWARTDRFAELHVEAVGGGRTFRATARALPGHDFAAVVSIGSLSPGTVYQYRAWFVEIPGSGDPPPEYVAHGRFETAPPADAPAPVTFGWSGDLGGINVCRDATRGYPIFGTMNGLELDFFLGLGDMIYSDLPCEERGFYGGNAQIPKAVREATTIRQYWENWRYNREDPGFRAFLASTAYLAMWDDHEVVNDFSRRDAWHAYEPYAFGADLFPLGLHAFFDQNAIRRDPGDPERLYRAFRKGKHLDLIVLDTRSYRDPNPTPDTPEKPKSMLGTAQRTWLLDRLTHSDATWKIVVSSIPISIPTGAGGKLGHDGWCNMERDDGYENELASIFRALHGAGTRNVVFLTTDVHFATGFRYRPLADAPEFIVHEFVAGPLGSMLLPTHSLDDTFHPERLFFFGPETIPKTFDEAQRFMNWGKIAISGSGALLVTIQDGLGGEAARVTLEPQR